MTNTTNRQASIDSRRVSLEREISIRVPRFDTFVTEYSQDISTTGMFILSDNPQAPGTTFTFEFSVADDWKLIRGKAQVVWTRYRDEGPERPPGMGVRFLEIDAQSRRLVRWIVEKHIREGGKPFELDELRSVIDQALEQVLDTDEVPEPNTATSGAAKAAPPHSRSTASVRSAASKTMAARSDRRAWPLLLTAAAVLITVGLLFWLTELLPGKRLRSAVGAPEQSTDGSPVAGAAADTSDPGTPRPETAVAGSSSPRATGLAGNGAEEAVASRQASSEVAGEAPPIGSSYKSVLNSISEWTDAWSDQDPSAYLSSYAESFTPGGGLTRSQWEAQRRERLARPDFIKVSISGLELERLDNRRVRVTFSQSYRSDRFSDLVRKTMDLVWEQGRWKIASEAAI